MESLWGKEILDVQNISQALKLRTIWEVRAGTPSLGSIHCPRPHQAARKSYATQPGWPGHGWHSAFQPVNCECPESVDLWFCFDTHINHHNF